jgi:hypothetical protein
MLRYVGAGAFLMGVPARDLDDDEIAAAGWSRADLVASGLYEDVSTETPSALTPGPERGEGQQPGGERWI